MTALVFAQTDSTGQKVTLIVFALVAVAAALALLTAWYWRVTDPAERTEKAEVGWERKGGGGHRNLDRSEPDPSPDHGESPPSEIGGTDRTKAPAADPTQLMTRSEILGQPATPATPNYPQSPDVIDLRDDSAADSSDIVRPAADVTGEIDVAAPGPNESVLDLDSVDQESIQNGDQARAGAHDDGIDFEDWLALAEEES